MAEDIGKKALIGAGIGALIPVAAIPIIGGFGMVAMGGGIGTGLVAGVSTIVGLITGGGSEAADQLGDDDDNT